MHPTKRSERIHLCRLATLSKVRESLGDAKCPVCNTSIVFRQGRSRPYAHCLCLKQGEKN